MLGFKLNHVSKRSPRMVGSIVSANLGACERIPWNNLFHLFSDCFRCCHLHWDELSNGTNVTTAQPYDPTNGEEVPEIYMNIYIAIRIAFGILTLSGNSLTILAIYKFQNLRTATNYYVASLAVADLLSGLYAFLRFAVVHFIENTRSYGLMCIVAEVTKLLGISGNILAIFWVTIDRFLYIVFPFKYIHFATEKKTRLIIIISWVYVCLVCLIPISLQNVWHEDLPCRFSAMVTGTVFNGLYTSHLVALAVTVVCLYVCIATVAWRHRQDPALPSVPTVDERSEALRHGLRITKMVAMVLGIYLIGVACMIAIAIVNNRTSGQMLFFLDRGLSILWWTNCWANPFIYAWKSREFRSAFRKLLRFRQHPSGSAGGSSGSSNESQLSHQRRSSSKCSA